MTGYGASVLNNPNIRLLIVVPNWLGDGIMAMPALQVLRERLHPDATISVAARPGQVGLWEMHSAITRVISVPARSGDLLASARLLKPHGFTHAALLPHSFRSALLPALAGIPNRRGTVSQCGRRFLIQDPVSLTDYELRHQQWEIAKLLLPDPLPDDLPSPALSPPVDAQDHATGILNRYPSPILACIPGAARGPSKQWPGERFQEVAVSWTKKTGGSVCWLGTPSDAELCTHLNASLGEHGVSLAGETTLKTFTAILKNVDHALVNDSGGMHLAAAVGTPLTAIFGNTDPSKTGPLSENSTVIQHSDQRNRSIDRNSGGANAALARVTSQEVEEAVLANFISNA